MLRSSAKICGFSPSAILEADKTLKLTGCDKSLYKFLAESCGPFGCYPSQLTIGRFLSTAQQHVSRHVARLIEVGLVRVERGAYGSVHQRFACNSYHFVRHEIFARYSLSGVSQSLVTQRYTAESHDGASNFGT